MKYFFIFVLVNQHQLLLRMQRRMFLSILGLLCCSFVNINIGFASQGKFTDLKEGIAPADTEMFSLVFMISIVDNPL